jgi:hypothetical protein
MRLLLTRVATRLVNELASARQDVIAVDLTSGLKAFVGGEHVRTCSWRVSYGTPTIQERVSRPFTKVRIDQQGVERTPTENVNGQSDLRRRSHKGASAIHASCQRQLKIWQCRPYQASRRRATDHTRAHPARAECLRSTLSERRELRPKSVPEVSRHVGWGWGPPTCLHRGVCGGHTFPRREARLRSKCSARAIRASGQSRVRGPPSQ